MRKHVVIIGGGFAGLYAAQSLRRANVDLTLIDRRNFHLFQPLLYQVATGGLSPADIASPLRGILARQKNVRVLQGEATQLDAARRRLRVGESWLNYDFLIVATGSKHHYFGNVQWAHAAPGLKTVEDALTMRRNVLSRFEQAERESDPRRRRALLTFVIVGGGPTGVELAGAVAELAKHTLKHNFRSIDPATAEIVLVEATDRVLSAYPPELSAKAEKSLQRLGATVHCDTLVKHVAEDHVVIARDDGETVVPTCCVLWAAGVTASRFGGRLAAAVGAETDGSGRIYVEGTLTLPGHKEIFVCGDLAHIEQEGQPLPGLAPVAMQQGAYAAKVIRNRLRGKTTPGFHYRDWGMMAVIGRAAAVAQIGPLRLGGFLAWVAWLFIHLINLVEFENRVSVLLQWGWNYITRNRSARIITNDQLLMQETTENRPLDRGDGDRRAQSTSSSCQGPC